MGRIFTCFGILCVAAVVGLFSFAYVGHKDSLKRVDMAVLVGQGEYGSFLTKSQQKQLDDVLTKYHQGYFFDLYVAAPESLGRYAKVPFAVAEYLNDRGIGENQLLIDDKSKSLNMLATNVHSMMRSNDNPQVLVFASSLAMPRVKLAFSQADLDSTGYAHTSKLAFSDIPSLIGEVALFSKSVLGMEVTPKNQQVAIIDLAPVTVSADAGLLFKPLDLVSSADTQVAWQRVVVASQ